MALMNFNYLVQTEIYTEAETLSNRKYWFDKFPDLLNTIFESLYFSDKNSKTDLDKTYTFFVEDIYHNAAYTLRSNQILMSKGYYLESQILIRTLLEMFVKARYFLNKKDKCNDYIQQKYSVKYKNMMEDLAPGVHDRLYHLLSMFTHGKPGAGLYHNELIPPNTMNLILGCFYSEQFCNWSTNTALHMLYGYLNYIPIFFDAYEKLAPSEIKEKRINNIRWLEDRINYQISDHPKVKELYDVLFPLIRL